MEKTQDYGKNPAEALFYHAQHLPEGERVSIQFTTKQQANAFRVRLYRVRAKENDFSISISLDKTRVFCVKEKKTFEILHTDESGKEELQTITFKNETELTNIRQKELSEKASLSDIIDLFNMDIKLIERENYAPHIKRIETKKAFTNIFRDIDLPFIRKEIFISQTDDGIMSYARLRTKEEKDALS